LYELISRGILENMEQRGQVGPRKGRPGGGKGIRKQLMEGVGEKKGRQRLLVGHEQLGMKGNYDGSANNGQTGGSKG